MKISIAPPGIDVCDLMRILDDFARSINDPIVEHKYFGDTINTIVIDGSNHEKELGILKITFSSFQFLHVKNNLLYKHRLMAMIKQLVAIIPNVEKHK